MSPNTTIGVLNEREVENPLKVFTNTECEGYYAVGFAAVVVAESADKAADLLNVELKNMGLDQTALAEDMEEVSTSFSHTQILVDGNY